MSEDVIKIQDQYYILATSSRADDRTRVLKHGETFGVFDAFGNLGRVAGGEFGIYHGGTRHLSVLDVRLGSRRPLLLSSNVKEENDLLAVDLTNPDIQLQGDELLPRGVLHLFRSKFLWGPVCYERLRICSYGTGSLQASITFEFDGDFVDIFEVRGMSRPRRGRRLPDHAVEDTAVLAYEGLDGVVRRTRLTWYPAPHELTGSTARFDLKLPPGGLATVTLVTSCETGDSAVARLPYEDAFVLIADERARMRAQFTEISSVNGRFNDWVTRSATDLAMLLTETPHGLYPYAGVPWFNTPFGRDGIITALEVLWLDPGVARGVLAFLAATQATEVNDLQDAQPGKILHEMRHGEMAVLGEVPFGRYYGSVDATPLFVVLAGAYYQRTADRAFVQTIWPNVERALAWMERCGDLDGDGFIEYARRSPTGLVHQGWKDSEDAIFHADGTPASPPIALAEVQGYAYDAWRQAARLAAALGAESRAQECTRSADRLRAQFEAHFWCEERSTYALALDGRKEACQVRASNAGHCLFSGIATDERARRLGNVLLNDDSYSGWGIRTVSAREACYNPMSYHNGSVWPHDNAIIAAGLSRYGMQQSVSAIFQGFYEASTWFEFHRMPELYCGFHRRPGEGPTLYPVACSPQAWAAGAVFMLIQACLALAIDAPERRITFSRPHLPDFLPDLRISNLRVGDARVDLICERHGPDTDITVERREGDLEIVIVK